MGSRLVAPRLIVSVYGACTRVKYISSLLLASNCIPLVAAHLSHILYASSSRLQHPWVSLLNARIFVLSAKPTTAVPLSRRRLSYSIEIYSIKRIGESGEPCGTPALIGLHSIVSPSNTRRAVQSSR